MRTYRHATVPPGHEYEITPKYFRGAGALELLSDIGVDPDSDEPIRLVSE